MRRCCGNGPTFWAFVSVGLLVAASAAGCGSEAGSKRSGKKHVPSQAASKSLAQGKDYLTQGNRKKAIAAYTRAIKDDPKCKDAYLWRGVAYNESGNPKAALADFSKVIQLDPTNTYAYEQRAAIYEGKLHDPAKAKADRDKAFELRQKNRDDMRTRLKGKKKPAR